MGIGLQLGRGDARGYLELLATVHWVCTREGATTGDEAITRTYAWNERKRGFNPHQISVARDVLVSQRWL